MKNSNRLLIINQLFPIIMMIVGSTAGLILVYFIMQDKTLEPETKGLALGSSIGVIAASISNAASLASPLSLNNTERIKNDTEN